MVGFVSTTATGSSVDMLSTFDSVMSREPAGVSLQDEKKQPSTSMSKLTLVSKTLWLFITWIKAKNNQDQVKIEFLNFIKT